MTNEKAIFLDELPNQEEITCLSELRASYSCFDEKEEPFYRALSKGIEALRKYLPDSVSEGDVIYREAAIAVADFSDYVGLDVDDVKKVTDEVVKGLKALPPAQPEKQRGYWIIDERPESDREVICSICEQPVFKYHKLDFDYRPRYCPNCGKEMREVTR